MTQGAAFRRSAHRPHALRARGVVFEEYDLPGVTMRNGIATGCGARTAWFKDTEGNILAIAQRIE